MRHVSIRALMGTVVILAVALAALRNANDYWAGGMLMATPLLIGVAVVGAFYRSGSRRAARLGFAIFAGGYFALAFLGLSAPKLDSLPTSWLLSYVHERVVPPMVYSITGGVMDLGLSDTVVSGSSTVDLQARPITITPPVQLQIESKTLAATSVSWKAMLPGAANYEAFTSVGHCLFTLTAGLLGSIIALRYEASREG